MYLVRLIILLLFALSTMSFSLFNLFKSRDYVDMANEIKAKVAKNLVQRHKMELIGEGGGMNGSVYMIGLHFKIYRPMNRSEARARITDCVEELLTAVNENIEIRPYLRDYPFTTKNVEIVIYTAGPNREMLHDPNLGLVSVWESNCIKFATYKNSTDIAYKNVFWEPYPEALAFVKDQNCPVPTTLSNPWIN